MNDVKITYRGWPGHYILSKYCQFRLNTLIEYGDTKIVVSTVGRCLTPDNKNFHELNFIPTKRFGETLVFVAQEKDGFWDADVTKQITCIKSNCFYSECEKEMQAGHGAIVAEVVDKLEKNVVLYNICEVDDE